MAGLTFDDLVPGAKKKPLAFDDLVPKPQQFLEAREPGMLERAGNWLQDNNILPVSRMKRDLQSADDLARLAASGATFNQADRIAGALPGGEGTEKERAKTAISDVRSGGAGDIAEMAGAVALPVGVARQGLTLVGKGAQALPGIWGALTRTGLMGAEGAGYGAATAAGDGTDIAEGAKWGGIFGSGGQLIGDAVGGIVNALKGAPASPSLDALRSAKTAAYKRTEELGVRYTPEAYKDAVIDIFNTAKSKNVSPTRHPQAVDKMRQLGEYVDNGASPTLTEMDQLRQEVWRDVGNSTDPAEKEFGRMMVDKIDDMIDSAKGTSVSSGSAEEASSAIKEARELNRRYKNAERFDEAMVKAKRRTDSTDSGGNLENAQRQNARQILDNPRKAKFLNKEESDALEQMVAGTPGQNRARKVGKFLHSIPGMGSSLGLGTGLAFLNPVAGALPIAAALAGGGLKGISRGIGNKNKAIAEALIKTGSKPGPDAMSPERVQMIVRALLGSGINARNQLGHQ